MAHFDHDAAPGRPSSSTPQPPPSRRPRTKQDLPPLERLLVTMVRHVAAGQDALGLARLAAGMIRDDRVQAVAGSAFAVAAGLDDAEGPDILVHPIPCRRLSGDEITVVRLVAASQAGDAESAATFAACLVSPRKVPDILGRACALAEALRGAGHAFELDFPAPRVVWPA